MHANLSLRATEAAEAPGMMDKEILDESRLLRAIHAGARRSRSRLERSRTLAKLTQRSGLELYA
jgi:hypothetical protein